MTSEISREEFEVEFRRLEGEWEVLKKGSRNKGIQ